MDCSVFSFKDEGLRVRKRGKKSEIRRCEKPVIKQVLKKLGPREKA